MNVADYVTEVRVIARIPVELANNEVAFKEFRDALYAMVNDDPGAVEFMMTNTYGNDFIEGMMTCVAQTLRT